MDQQQPKPQEKMIRHLQALKAADNRGALAHLRRGAADPLGDPNVLSIIGRDIPPDLSDTEFEAYLITACMFALDPQFMSNSSSFGRAIRTLQWKFNDSPSVDARFTGLLECHREELPMRLRHLFHMLGDKEIWIDYSQLLDDLTDWDNPDREVQRRWAKDYWTTPSVRQESEVVDSEANAND